MKLSIQTKAIVAGKALSLAVIIGLAGCGESPDPPSLEEVSTEEHVPVDPLAATRSLSDNVKDLSDRTYVELPGEDEEIAFFEKFDANISSTDYIQRILDNKDDPDTALLRSTFQNVNAMASQTPELFWELIKDRTNRDQATRADLILYHMASIAIMDNTRQLSAAISTDELQRICNSGNPAYTLVALDVLRVKAAEGNGSVKVQDLKELIEDSPEPVKFKAISVIGRLGGEANRRYIHRMMEREELSIESRKRLQGALDEMRAIERFKGLDLGP